MSRSKNFNKKLQYGQAGESLIANWLKTKKFNIIPVYEKIIDTGKGPQVFTMDCKRIVAPDLLCFNQKNTIWVEAKRKKGFSWHRKTKKWVTGIDIRHYKNYLELLNNYSPYDIFLFFLQEGGSTIGCNHAEKQQPSGLYVGNLRFLSKNENHRSSKWGNSGMVYWSEDILIKKAEYKDIVDCYQDKL